MPKMAELGGAGYTRIDDSSSPLREELAAARQKERQVAEEVKHLHAEIEAHSPRAAAAAAAEPVGLVRRESAPAPRKPYQIRHDRRERAEEELRRQLDQISHDIKRAENREQYTLAERLDRERAEKRTWDLDDPDRVTELLGDEGIDEPSGVAALVRRCTGYVRKTRRELIEANTAQMERLEHDIFELRDVMLKHGREKRYGDAATIKRQVLLKKDKIEELRSEVYELEQEIAEEKRLRRQGSALRRREGAQSAEAEAEKTTLAEVAERFAAATADPEQIRAYRDAFSQALQKLPIYVSGVGSLSHGYKNDGGKAWRELLLAKNGDETPVTERKTARAQGQQGPKPNKRSAWKAVRELLPLGYERMVTFERKEDAAEFVHSINTLIELGPDVRCIWAPPDEDDSLSVEEFVGLMKLIDPSLFIRAKAKGVSAEDAIEQLLVLVDSDNSGDVSWSEFRKAVTSFGKGQDLRDGCICLFKSHGDGDGGEEWDVHIMRDFFNQTASVQAGIHKAGAKMTLDEANVMVTEGEALLLSLEHADAQTNSNGTLDQEELLAILHHCQEGASKGQLPTSRKHWQELKRKAAMAGAMDRLHLQAKFGLSDKMDFVSTRQSRAKGLSEELHCAVATNSPVYLAWSATQLVLLCTIALLTPMRTAFGVCAPWGSTLFSVDLFIDTFFLCDIVLNFFVIDEDSDGIRDFTHSMIARRYLRGWFMVDSVSSIPVSYIVLIMGHHIPHGMFLRALRFIRLFKLVKLMRIKQKVSHLAVDVEDDRMRNTLGVLEGTLNICKYIFSLVYLTHILTCLWYAAGCSVEYTEEDGRLDGWVIVNGWWGAHLEQEGITECLDGAIAPPVEVCPFDCFPIDATSAHDRAFCDAVLNDGDASASANRCELAGRCSTNSTVASRHGCELAAGVWGAQRCEYRQDSHHRTGDGAQDCDNIPSVWRRYFTAFLSSLDGSATQMAGPQTEKLFTIVQLLIYRIFFGFLTATIASTILQNNASRQRYQDKLQSVQDFCQTTKVKGEVRKKMLDHFRARYPGEAIIDESDIIPELPPWLRSEVATKLHSVWMQKIPLFASMHQLQLLTIFDHLKTMVVPAGHVVVRQGQACTACFFIEEGVVQMINGKHEVGFVKPGSFFSEDALWWDPDGPEGRKAPKEIFNGARCTLLPALPARLVEKSLFHSDRLHGGAAAVPGGFLQRWQGRCDAQGDDHRAARPPARDPHEGGPGAGDAELASSAGQQRWRKVGDRWGAGPRLAAEAGDGGAGIRRASWQPRRGGGGAKGRHGGSSAPAQAEPWARQMKRGFSRIAVGS